MKVILYDGSIYGCKEIEFLASSVILDGRLELMVFEILKIVSD